MCAKQRKECFLREVLRQREFKLRQNFPSWRDLDGSVVYLKVSDFFLGGNCSSECYIIVIVLHVLGHSSGKTTLGAPEPREDEGLTQATHGFVGEGTLSQVWPFLC